MTKNLIKEFLIVSTCIMLSGCADAGTFEEGDADHEAPTTIEDDMIQNDMPDGDQLVAIFYNGVCYYGLPMGERFEVGGEPEGFTYIGKLSSVKEGYESPTEELAVALAAYNVSMYVVGEDVYYYVDEEGYHNFCIPTGGADSINYKGIYKATAQKPAYFREASHFDE